jgi:hypothetical protein
MKRDLEPLKAKLRSDRRVKRLLTMFQELPLYQIPYKALMTEVERIHQTRNIRFLSVTSPTFLEDVVDASVRDQSNRSRLTEISVQCFKARASLQEALDPMREYLLLTYAPDMGFVRTKEERKSLVDMALAPFGRFVKRTEVLSTMCDMVVADIDKASWSLRLNVNAYQVRNKPENTI